MAPPRKCDCGTCERCKHRERARAHYWRNRDKVCETARASRKRRAEDVRAYDRERGYRPSETVKTRARMAVKTAIDNGTLTRHPCEVCGERVTDAHHDDYSRPLDVRWLCRVHHGIEHRREAA